ncbi:MAG: hypothetical protein Q7S48_02040 [bacterium]|nr:hypothetical protein [bacterium]
MINLEKNHTAGDNPERKDEAREEAYKREVRAHEKQAQDKLIGEIALKGELPKGVSVHVRGGTDTTSGNVVAHRLIQGVPADKILLTVTRDPGSDAEVIMGARASVLVTPKTREIVDQTITWHGLGDHQKSAEARRQVGGVMGDKEYAIKFPTQYRQGEARAEEVVAILESIGYTNKRNQIQAAIDRLAQQYFENPDTAPTVVSGWSFPQEMETVRQSVEYRKYWARKEAEKQVEFELQTDLRVPYPNPRSLRKQ